MSKKMHDFDLTFEGFYKSDAVYEKDENSDTMHLKFDPPVYQQRYSTVLNILQHKNWNSEIKKVIFFF